MNDSAHAPTHDEASPESPRGLVRSAYETSTAGFRAPVSSLWEIEDDEDEDPEDVLK